MDTNGLTKNLKTAIGINIVVALVLITFLVAFGIRIFSSYTVIIGPNDPVWLYDGSVIVIDEPVIVQSQIPLSFTNVRTNEVSNMEIITPELGEPYYAITNPPSGTYRSSYEAKVYSLTPTTVITRHNYLGSLGIMAFLTACTWGLHYFISFFVTRHFAKKDAS